MLPERINRSIAQQGWKSNEQAEKMKKTEVENHWTKGGFP
jgi:hypothetical protein